ncbi:armadillo-type protein [Cantharellus anzutake]|uniref:armadillo-type protein n=1 Tax=Cantharellus anzutake TaxID=1750568 RepID=UPI0019057FE1|nr:armadillo-type protein [Cantharellus anzutake]KAF8321414.1 armadillo-type protein [Cantharellus anzutake]
MFFEEGEELGPLEKIYLFSRSRAVFHRVYISRTLAKFLPLITPHEAVEYVLPLLNGLGTDQDDSVREAFVSELVPIMWWFFEQAGVTNADPSASSSDDTPSPRPKLHVQTFTPLLGSLLLSVNPSIGDAARWGIVELLARLRESPEALEAGPVSWGGMPSSKERRIIERELVFGVVIGMARLDWEHDQGEFGGEAGPVAGEGRDGDDDETERWSSTWGSAAGSVADLPPIASEGQDNTLGHSGAAESSPSALSAVSWTTVESTPSLSLSVQTAPSSDDIVPYDPEDDQAEEAAVGRVASMSLIAAVTAIGPLNDDVTPAFLEEVERVGSDPVHWVRREAAYALGALAKVISDEEVIHSLFPLYNSFISDRKWRVRYSALFALPGLLSRLAITERRSYAISQLTTLTHDVSRSVRLGTLEILGEVIHTFCDDQDGLPSELIDLFMGKVKAIGAAPNVGGSTTGMRRPPFPRGEGTHFEKNLIRAFSFPAVALTLGRDRWGELKAFYAQLAGAAQTGTDKPSAGSVNAKVRKTLAASIGEMAKIVGSKAAVEDLVPVLYGLLRHGSEEIKIKAIESLDVFLEAIDETERGPIGRELERMWAGEDFDRIGFGWRVRDAFSRKLGVLSGILRKEGNVVRSLVMKALVDPVAAIRESAVDFLPTCIQNLGVSTVAAKRLRADVESFAIADTSKRRTTFVYCIQALALSQALGPLEISKGSFWKVLRGLAQDPVIDVRIAVSRLVSLVCCEL